MRNFLRVCFIVVLLLPAVSLAAERINDFTSEIEIETDGSFTVSEQIVYDFGVADRHGIFRTIPLTHPQEASSWYKERRIELADIAVTRNDNPAPMDITRSNNELEIRIGDPDRTITGEHTYTISYTVLGGLSYYETEPPEFYWNVTGSEWEVPIETASVRVTAPAGALQTARTCYAGPSGTGGAESDTCQMRSDGEMVVFTTGTLMPGEELTVAQALSETVVETQVREYIPLWYWFGPFLGFLMVGLGWWLYRYKTAHRPRNRTVIAQYEPYPDVLPMYAGVLIDGTLHPHDITAGLLYLAQEGFLRITKTDRKVLWLFDVDDYEITLLRPIAEAPTTFHSTILGLLFDETKGVLKQDGTHNTVRMSELKSDTAQQKRNNKALKKLKEAVRTDLVERGFFERNFPYTTALTTALLLLFVPQFALSFLGGPWLVGVIAALGMLFVALFVLYRRRTRKGYEALYHLKGFKEFLSVTGEKRFAFHNAPEKSPQQFMEYLPYAVAFGVEKEWAEVFADITIPQPEWYHSSNAGAFSAAALTSDLDAFASSFSSSSGSSASTGGGSAGGGAGGGGGGSW